MNEHDIVAYGWDWKLPGDAEPTEPVQWYDGNHASLARVEDSMTENGERVFLRLRNGQAIRVKLKEQHA